MQHLLTPIEGELRDPVHLLELGGRLHPTPAVCGLPGEEARRWIADHETTTCGERGGYAGAVGHFDAHGDGELRVALRCALLRRHEALVWAGAGLVAGSDPERELEEIAAKSRTMLRAFAAPARAEEPQFTFGSPAPPRLFSLPRCLSRTAPDVPTPSPKETHMPNSPSLSPPLSLLPGHLRPTRRRFAVGPVAPVAVLACLLGLALGIVTAGTAVAEEHDLQLDPAATDLTFHLEATGHDVEGHLYLKEGRLHYDTDTGAASGRIVLSALRTDTGNQKRDKTMHQKVLESTLLPEIVFVPQRIEGDVDDAGAGHFDFQGTITLHGDEHAVSMPTDVEVDESGKVSAHATLDVPFVEWGLEDPSVLFLRVGKVVNVDIRFSAPLDGGDMPSAVAGSMDDTVPASPAAHGEEEGSP